MTKIEPKDFKREGIVKVYDAIVKGHVVAKHTIVQLMDNKHVKNFCVVSRHFCLLNLSTKETMFCHYDMSHWLKNNLQIVGSIDSIKLYDDFMEYEKARLSQLHGAKDADIPNIN